MRKWTIPFGMFFLCLLFLLPDQGLRIQANAEGDSEEVANPPKIEEKLGAVPDLSSDSDVAKREAESMSRKTLRSNAEKFEFQTEALDKIRFCFLTDKEVLGEGENMKLEILVSDGSVTLSNRIKRGKILSIRNKGTGMKKEDLIKNLGTIAKSGTSAFVEKMQTSGDLNLIGQFGVGLYPVYLVADYVEVISKHNDDKLMGNGDLVEEAGEYLDEFKLKDLVKKYSKFINFPIYLWASKLVKMEVTADDDESAIWLWNPKEVTDKEYTKFYHSLAKMKNPWLGVTLMLKSYSNSNKSNLKFICQAITTVPHFEKFENNQEELIQKALDMIQKSADEDPDESEYKDKDVSRCLI
ncbi:hypothetical protein Nepgr_015513 [Nepenthes gracilis]|uniref:Uncharacterized protein n=1 Tax=Nepenthes gracilis TaxID=150966 RepID=A0AAD3SM81_NEPGR|nr:hypothetical protein Nepgr_015513 [Nepenthes gracilis]